MDLHIGSTSAVYHSPAKQIFHNPAACPEILFIARFVVSPGERLQWPSVVAGRGAAQSATVTHDEIRQHQQGFSSVGVTC
ncbi:MAG: hypothetical protein ACUVSV_03780 [Armatimonadota bacterium]